MEKSAQMYENFLKEYRSDDAINRYTTATAGYGISHLLEHDYAAVYLQVVNSELRTQPRRPLRLLEFGCGGGMNIIHLVSLLVRRGMQVDSAVGTDFSSRLIEAAQQEAKNLLAPELAQKVNFCVARNESLLHDMALVGGVPVDDLLNSFDVIIGVNTFRYCHRLKNEKDCAADLHRLLRPGGVCVMIDMNNKFPAFRSRLKGRLKGLDPDEVECYLPTLGEYASPFECTGFEILRKDNFCWVPHSAGRALTRCCLSLSPLLNIVARSRAMRSLVVARKPV